MIYLWLAISMCALICWIFMRYPRLNIPGPRGLPIIGCYLQIDQERPQVTFTKWAKEYGPVFLVKMWNIQMVVVNDYELVYDIFVKRGNIFKDRANPFRVNLWTKGKKELFFGSPDVAHWRVLRKGSQKFITLMNRFSDENEKVVSDVVHSKMTKFASLNGIPFEARSELYDFALTVTHQLVFGEDKADDEYALFKESAEKLLTNIAVSGRGMILDIFPWLKIFPNKVYKELGECWEASEKLWDKKKKRFFQADNGEQPESAMKSAVNLQQSLNLGESGSVVDDLNLKLSMLELIAAGSETTTASLSALIIQMLYDTELLRKVREEVDHVIGRTARVTLEKRNQMPYTRAAIYETLRYTSLVPLGLPHAAMEDTTIGGYFIPKDTVVTTNLWHVHRDEQFWGDPDNFRPERFLDEHGQLLLADHPVRKHLLPFGAGPRVCLGGVFAMNRIFLFITSFVQRFDVFPEYPSKLPSNDPANYVVGLVTHPADFKIRVVPRHK